MLFQFRCGFSVPCDGEMHPEVLRVLRVSIPLWIFCSLRQVCCCFRRRVQRVSIPLWIFCSLRRVAGSAETPDAQGFNSVVDFLFPATRRLQRCRGCRMCFNSVVDFLFPATSRPISPSYWNFGFNSVVDFLFPATHKRRSASAARLPVSIPLWIFCSLRPDLVKVVGTSTPCFNSVVDFLFPATASALNGARRSSPFQFRCGFSVPCDAL